MAKYWLWVIITLSSSCSIKPLDTVPSAPTPYNALLQHLHYLSSANLRGRQVGTTGNKKAQNYIVQQLVTANVAPFAGSYLAPFSIKRAFNTTQASNVIGLIRGREFDDKYIVLSAHFDHIGARGSKIYSGADDNASGTAALLEFAKWLQREPLKHSVILLFTDAEEVNLNGAKFFIKDNTHLVNKIVLNINLDMIAGTKATKRLHYVSRKLKQVLSDETISRLQQTTSPIKIVKGFKSKGRRLSQVTSWQMASDHGAFYQQGIPFIYYGVGLHHHYHQPSDSYENINHEFFTLASHVILKQIRFIDENLYFNAQRYSER
ncbi:Peptidase family M28 [Colwellia chukchiensis]|uniref:Peptidase family M28 n=1 Tax=Colwellia chukchiensis TaxID=641665 RepID=A0A1H7MTG3_9GAMM|nr:M20/M25/M40 family metallo-hydrolase [Colwellia chukchiensis]SEL14514.1 Peptidase family M28 [Colwellia chukchiensis]